MTSQSYEQQILELAFETDARLTTASVTYYLGIPSERAEPLLEDLRERGVLELDSDEEGHLFYRVDDAAASQGDELAELRRERRAGIDGNAGGGSETNDRDSRLREVVARAGGARPDSDGDERKGGSQTDRADPPPPPPRTPTPSDGEGRAREARPHRGLQSTDVSDTARTESGSGSTASRDGTDAIAGATRRPAQRDAVVDNCDGRSVIVQTEASCAPDPLGEDGPELASCFDGRERTPSATEALAQRSDSRESDRSVAPRRRVEPASAPSETPSRPPAEREEDSDRLRRSQHQPGMSLLLSLILCGTGQIYNGEVSKGVTMMVLCFLLWFVLLGWVVHIWSIVDSVVVAERINQQQSGA